MRRLLTALVAGLLIASLNLPALAWEFDMRGEYENRFRYFGRTGDVDLFGVASLQDHGAGTFVGFAGPNIYGTGNVAPAIEDSSSGFMNIDSVGETITRGGFSRWGSDAFYNDSRLTLRPVLWVNPAIRVFGVYTVGGMRNKYRQTGTDAGGNGVGIAPLERYYMSQTSMNAYDGTFGSWEQFRATITFPWGIWSIGLKDFPLGTGATLAQNTRAEHFLWVTPYGPFRMLAAVWFANSRFFTSWHSVPDGTTKPTLFLAGVITYDSGALSMGVASLWRQFHQNQGSMPLFAPSYAGFNTAVLQPAPRDENTMVNLLYAKFNNGRFFANAEYSWVNLDAYFLGFGPSAHIEGNHFFAEAGVMGGPAKLSLMYALSSGLVLNNPNPTKVYLPYPINYQAMEPYEFLMFNTYAGGNNGGWSGNDVTFVSDGHGMMSDAYCYAARLDYAVASNLNAYGSYIWGHRLERAGFPNGGVQDIGNGSAGGVNPGTLLALYGGTTAFVPDGFIGWEANAGVDWKLLENMTFKARYSYWKPGQWFDYAYQAIGTRNGAVINPAADAAIVKGRSAINAFQASVLIEF